MLSRKFNLFFAGCLNGEIVCFESNKMTVKEVLKCEGAITKIMLIEESCLVIASTS